MKCIISALALLAPFIAFGQESTVEPAPATPPPAAAPAEAQPAPEAYERGGLLEGSEEIISSLEQFVAAQEAQEETLAGQPMVLTARKCVELAVTQNAQAFVAQDDLEAAQARIGQARSRMKPQVKGSMTFTHTEFNTRDMSSMMGGLGGTSSLGGSSSGLGSGGLLQQRPVLNFLKSQILGGMSSGSSLTSMFEAEDDIRTDKVELNQVFYAGGQIRAAINASKFLAESQEWQKEATLAQLEYQAKQAFYDAAASAALVLVAEASVTSFERNLADAQQMFDVGMVSSFEVLRAQTELGSRKADLVEARNVQQLAQANLRRTIAVPQDTPLALEAKLDWVPYTPDVDETVAFAYEHRPEILALRKGLDAAKADLDRVRGQYKPQVGGNIQWQNVDGGGFSQPDGWTFSVASQLDIYAGGRRKHETVESKAKIQSIEDQLKDLEGLVELDVTQAVIQIKDSLARIASENGTRKLAQEGLRLAELRFQEGVGTQSETLDAELALTNAERSLVQALRDLAVAYSSLERAIGESWVKEGEEETAVSGTPVAEPAPDAAAVPEQQATPAGK